MDKRLTPANARVAASHLKGQVETAHFTKGAARQLSVPVADLLTAPHGKRERQLLMGDAVTMYEDREGWAFVQSQKDGYVGYLLKIQLEDSLRPSHWVIAPATHLYSDADIKSHERTSLSFGAQVQVIDQTGEMLETQNGFLPHMHLAPLHWRFDDPVNVAMLFVGTPYLWGGNSRGGIDCSGLVQAACLACGISCPADSDMQMRDLGQKLPATEPLRRGDLVFWQGHVAMVVADNMLLHANAHHMAVAFEPIERAIERIKSAGDGPVLARKRLPKAPIKREKRP